jgi:6-pyruvoyltetrahydropterin/6-carboxytetrahydropterin synthase
MKISVTKLFEFEAAHHLPNYDGACANLHGHTYKLEVEVIGHVALESGMVEDFSLLKKAVKELVIDKYDHCNLNDWFHMPTAENMVIEIFNILRKSYNGMVTRVRLWETSTSYAEVKE